MSVTIIPDDSVIRVTSEASTELVIYDTEEENSFDVIPKNKRCRSPGISASVIVDDIIDSLGVLQSVIDHQYPKNTQMSDIEGETIVTFQRFLAGLKIKLS